MTKFERWLASENACIAAREWVAAQPRRTPSALYRVCPRGDWMLWAPIQAGVPGGLLRPAIYASADRAVRQYAPIALRVAGLTRSAETLEALPPVVDQETAEVAGWTAARAWAAAAATKAVWEAAEAAWAAWAAAEEATEATEVAWEAAALAAAAAGKTARTHEQLLQANDIRRLVPPDAIRAAFAVISKQIP